MKQADAPGRMDSDDYPDRDDDAGLMAAVGRGDRRAFTVLMERHMGFALAQASRMLGNAAEADEVAQEAFLRVWRTAAGWDPKGGGQFTTWLYRVVVNLCLDRCRRKTGLPLDEAGEIADSSPSGTELVATASARRLVAEALAELPPRQRAAMSLCYMAELSGPQAAQAMDITPSALEALLVRGRRSLRRFFSLRGLKELGDLL